MKLSEAHPLIRVLHYLSRKEPVESGAFWKVCEDNEGINPIQLENGGMVSDPLIPFRNYGADPAYKMTVKGRTFLQGFMRDVNGGPTFDDE